MDGTASATRYAKPSLKRFGTFRQLTRVGIDAGNDIGSVLGTPPDIGGCDSEDPGTEFGCGFGEGSR